VPFEEKDGEKLYLLPEAEAVVDPKQPGETYPFSGICGAVVAWKLLQVLGVKQDIIDKIYAKMPNKDELVVALAEMYNEPIIGLMDEPDEKEGNVDWTTSW
jgi:single-stranded-DNA-specific exonuclease